MAAVAVVAVPFAYYFTLTAHAGTGRDTCLRLRRRYLPIASTGFIVVIAVLVLADPDIGRLGGGWARARDFLMQLMLLLNVFVAAGTFLFVYYVVAAIVASSPRVWTKALTQPA